MLAAGMTLFWSSLGASLLSLRVEAKGWLTVASVRQAAQASFNPVPTKASINQSIN